MIWIVFFGWCQMMGIPQIFMFRSFYAAFPSNPRRIPSICYPSSIQFQQHKNQSANVQKNNTMSSDEVIELSIEETQALRAKLGLAPLRLGSNKDDNKSIVGVIASVSLTVWWR